MLGDGGAALTGCGSRPSPPPAGCVRIEARGRSEVCLLPPNSWCLQDTNQTGFYYHYHYCDIIMVIISNDWRKNKQWEHKLGYLILSTVLRWNYLFIIFLVSFKLSELLHIKRSVMYFLVESEKERKRHLAASSAQS